MLFDSHTLNDLRTQLGGPAADATTRGYRFAVARTAVVPLDFARAGASMFGSVRYLQTADGAEIAGVGTSLRIRAAGHGRFLTIASELRELPHMPAAARLMCGFSFHDDGPRSEAWDGFGAADVVLPEIAVINDAAGRRIVAAVPPGADAMALVETLQRMEVPDPVRPIGFGDHSVHSVPPSDDWKTIVGEAVAAIGESSFDKVVLARSVVVTTELGLDPFEIVHHLGMRNPGNHVFGWQVGESCFVGASPELLVGKLGAQVTTSPLAGSTARGASDDEDQSLGEALMTSEKDRMEHALMVDDIAERLRAVTLDLHVPEEPSLRKNPTVQHLGTDLTGTLVDGTGLFDVVDQIHPTAAVGGVPRVESGAFIDKVESIDRGWYSGGIGWLSPAGDGDIAIALRCALIDGNQATLYAGNGIVAASNPVEELDESRWKLRPMLNLLTAP